MYVSVSLYIEIKYRYPLINGGVLIKNREFTYIFYVINWFYYAYILYIGIYFNLRSDLSNHFIHNRTEKLGKQNQQL